MERIFFPDFERLFSSLPSGIRQLAIGFPTFQWILMATRGLGLEKKHLTGFTGLTG
jgi:hypothetical protein